MAALQAFCTALDKQLREKKTLPPRGVSQCNQALFRALTTREENSQYAWIPQGECLPQSRSSWTLTPGKRREEPGAAGGRDVSSSDDNEKRSGCSRGSHISSAISSRVGNTSLWAYSSRTRSSVTSGSDMSGASFATSLHPEILSKGDSTLQKSWSKQDTQNSWTNRCSRNTRSRRNSSEGSCGTQPNNLDCTHMQSNSVARACAAGRHNSPAPTESPFRKGFPGVPDTSNWQRFRVKCNPVELAENSRAHRCVHTLDRIPHQKLLSIHTCSSQPHRANEGLRCSTIPSIETSPNTTVAKHSSTSDTESTENKLRQDACVENSNEEGTSDKCAARLQFDACERHLGRTENLQRDAYFETDRTPAVEKHERQRNLTTARAFDKEEYLSNLYRELWGRSGGGHHPFLQGDTATNHGRASFSPVSLPSSSVCCKLERTYSFSVQPLRNFASRQPNRRRFKSSEGYGEKRTSTIRKEGALTQLLNNGTYPQNNGHAHRLIINEVSKQHARVAPQCPSVPQKRAMNIYRNLGYAEQHPYRRMNSAFLKQNSPMSKQVRGERRGGPRHELSQRQSIDNKRQQASDAATADNALHSARDSSTGRQLLDATQQPHEETSQGASGAIRTNGREGVAGRTQHRTASKAQSSEQNDAQGGEEAYQTCSTMTSSSILNLSAQNSARTQRAALKIHQEQPFEQSLASLVKFSGRAAQFPGRQNLYKATSTVLGHGFSGDVRIYKHRYTDELVAIKTVLKRRKNKETKKPAEAEDKSSCSEIFTSDTLSKRTQCQANAGRLRHPDSSQLQEEPLYTQQQPLLQLQKECCPQQQQPVAMQGNQQNNRRYPSFLGVQCPHKQFKEKVVLHERYQPKLTFSQEYRDRVCLKSHDIQHSLKKNKYSSRSQIHIHCEGSNPSPLQRFLKTADADMERDLQAIMGEGVYTFLTADHPCAVKLLEVLEDEEGVHLVMPICKGGSLSSSCLSLGSRSRFSVQHETYNWRAGPLRSNILHNPHSSSSYGRGIYGHSGTIPIQVHQRQQKSHSTFRLTKVEHLARHFTWQILKRLAGGDASCMAHRGCCCCRSTPPQRHLPEAIEQTKPAAAAELAAASAERAKTSAALMQQKKTASLGEVAEAASKPSSVSVSVLTDMTGKQMTEELSRELHATVNERQKGSYTAAAENIKGRWLELPHAAGFRREKEDVAGAEISAAGDEMRAAPQRDAVRQSEIWMKREKAGRDEDIPIGDVETASRTVEEMQYEKRRRSATGEKEDVRPASEAGITAEAAASATTRVGNSAIVNVETSTTHAKEEKEKRVEASNVGAPGLAVTTGEHETAPNRRPQELLVCLSMQKREKSLFENRGKEMHSCKEERGRNSKDIGSKTSSRARALAQQHSGDINYMRKPDKTRSKTAITDSSDE